jgi:hypothetical protein
MKIVYNSKDNPCDIYTKFGSIYASGLWEIDLNFKSEQMTTTTMMDTWAKILSFRCWSLLTPKSVWKMQAGNFIPKFKKNQRTYGAARHLFILPGIHLFILPGIHCLYSLAYICLHSLAYIVYSTWNVQHYQINVYDVMGDDVIGLHVWCMV